MICFVEQSIHDPWIHEQAELVGEKRILFVGLEGFSFSSTGYRDPFVLCNSIQDVIGPGKILISNSDEDLEEWTAAGLITIDVRNASTHAIRERIEWVVDRSNSRMKIVFPKPPKPLHPNDRPTWRKKANAVTHYRDLCSEIAAGTALDQFGERPKFDRAEIQTVWYHGTGEKTNDPDNLIAWLKSGFDALTVAGVLSDDKQLIHLPPVQLRDRDRPRVEINITPLV